MTCPTCEAPRDAQMRFCGHCGAAFPRICPHCSFTNPATHAFCGGCGKSLDTAAAPKKAGEAEHRRITVLFCDLAGSTELADRIDPEALRDLILEYQRVAVEVIERFGGYVAQYLGDGVMAYFGYPRAHEDDPARAVHSGLGIVRQLEELNVDTL